MSETATPAIIPEMKQNLLCDVCSYIFVEWWTSATILWKLKMTFALVMSMREYSEVFIRLLSCAGPSYEVCIRNFNEKF